MPFEGVSVQTVPFEGIITPAFRGILYCPLWVNCLNNIQSITSALSFCECSSLLPACWYLKDFFTQLMEVTWSYLLPIITILIEFLQKIIVWHNEFMWHWVISLQKTRNCTHLTQLHLSHNLYLRQDFVAATQKLVQDNLKFYYLQECHY